MALNAPNLQAPIEGLIGRRYSLAAKQVADLWDSRASDEIRKAPFWQRYTEHRARRHGIVHEGDSAGDDLAARSIAVAAEVCVYVSRRAP